MKAIRKLVRHDIRDTPLNLPKPETRSNSATRTPGSYTPLHGGRMKTSNRSLSQSGSDWLAPHRSAKVAAALPLCWVK